MKRFPFVPAASAALGLLLALGVAAFSFIGCGQGSTPIPSDCLSGSATSLSNQDVYNRLGATCKSCHDAGANKPYFSSLSAFEQQLVYSTKWVVKGDPSGSPLLTLLRGKAGGSLPQMPLGGAPFEALSAEGSTKITMAELESWIQSLPEPGQNTAPEPVSGVQRLTAEQLLAVFDRALDIAPDELVGTTLKQQKALPVQSPDKLDPITVAYPYDQKIGEIVSRFPGLGGPGWMAGQKRVSTFTPTAVQIYIQLSQARCRYAVEQQKKAIFRDATAMDTSASNAAGIRKNIGQLHLRILGEPATAEDIEGLYADVFVPYEKTSTTAAWTGVCASQRMRIPQMWDVASLEKG